MPEPITVAIVPHTHWDREWYEPFPVARVRLVRLLDNLLTLLETDPSFSFFLLDGQTAPIDDYLAVRPEQLPRLVALTRAGRIETGPWATLPDEFVVSGETLVRNLQRGIARASALGGLLGVGYLPDSFGHIAQMPQLLRLAGLAHAVVWRGVPAALPSTAFGWEAPDGSTVRAEYLYGSYANGRGLPAAPEQLVARTDAYVAELGDAHPPGAPILLMNGGDRTAAQPELGPLVAAANAHQRHYRFSITSLSSYVTGQTDPAPPTWRGELRSGARANLLMGVASNRVDVHRAAAAAERALERIAEPLSALFLPADRYPAALLDLGWEQLIANSAHDSACACSSDDVVDAVLVRYAEARLGVTALTDHVLAALAAGTASPSGSAPGSTSGSVLVVNPAPRARDGIATVRVPVEAGDVPLHFVADDGTPCPTQVRALESGDGLVTVVTGRKIHWVLELLRDSCLAGTPVTRVERHQTAPDTWEYVVHSARPGEPVVDVGPLHDELRALGDAGATIHLRQRLAPVRVVEVRAPAVPGFGWRTLTPAPGPGPTSTLQAAERSLTNEHLTVTVDPESGTFGIRTHDGMAVSGLDRLVDGGDGGDTYNYSPPDDDEIIDTPLDVHISVLDTGPVRARLLVERTYDLPAHAVGDEHHCSGRSPERVRTEIRTTLELRSDERFVRIHTELDHRVRDHRLRAHFPLPVTVDGSDAECAYAVVHRDLIAEGGSHELALPTFPSRRFVDASGPTPDRAVGLTLLHDGLLEYEVVEDGRELALTLLRATGYLSRTAPALRPNPAGPPLPLAGPQLPGPQVAEYAVLLHPGDWVTADAYAAADQFLLPMLVAADAGAGAGRTLAVTGAEVAAVYRDAGRLVVRLFNPRSERSTVVVTLHGRAATGSVIDLLGTVVVPFAERVDLGPAQILTLRLDG